MASVQHPTASWEAMQDGNLLRKHEVYTMQWKVRNLGDYIVAGARYGGPIAMIRDPHKVVAFGANQFSKPTVQVFSSSGELLQTVPWDQGKLMALGWTFDERFVILNDEGMYRLYDLQGEYQQFSLGSEALEVGIIDAKIYEQGMVAMTSHCTLMEVKGWTGSKPLVLAHPGPFVKLSVSPNGKWLALLTAANLLWVVSSDFQTSSAEYDSAAEGLGDPRQLVWCGNDAVILAWDSLALIVGPSGQTIRHYYDSPPFAISELDGVRIVNNEHCDFIQTVPASCEKVFSPGSTDPGAVLLDAFDNFERKSPKAEENFRSIRPDLAKAVDTVVEAAGQEIEPYWQRRLLHAAQFGRAFLDLYDPSDFVNMGLSLKVLNAARYYEIGIPITYVEFTHTGPEHLINRLTARNLHLLALRISEHLHIQPDGVLRHWAVAKIRRSRADDEDAAVCKTIVTKFQDAGRAVSYAEIAQKAWESGRAALATMLLDHEPRAADQVPLLLTMKEDTVALTKAIDSGDTELVYTVLLHLQRHMSLGDFFRLIEDGGPRLASASNLLQVYAREQNRELLRDYYFQDDRRVDSACLALEDAATSKDAAQKLDYLRNSAKFFQEDKERAFEAKMMDDSVRLMTFQQTLEKEAGGKVTFVGASVNETVRLCLVNGLSKRADKLRADWKIPDKRFWYIKLYALTEICDFEALDAFAASKKSPIGYEPFVSHLVKSGYKSQASRYVVKCDVKRRIDLYVLCGEWKKAALECKERGDKAKLDEMLSNFFKLGKNAAQAIKHVKLLRNEVYRKAMSLTGNSTSGCTPFISFSKCCELAQLSFDDLAFSQITKALDYRLRDRKKWRQALMVLSHCVQEGSVRFEAYCNTNRYVLLQLASFPYTCDEDRDCGIEIRREAGKLLWLLSDPTMLASIRAHLQSSIDISTPILSLKYTTRLCRRGALMRIHHSRNTTSSADQITPYVITSPATISPDWEAVIEAMKPLVVQIVNSFDFLGMLEALVERLITDGYCMNYPEVLEALTLLRSHLSNPPEPSLETMETVYTDGLSSRNGGSAARIDTLAYRSTSSDGSSAIISTVETQELAGKESTHAVMLNPKDVLHESPSTDDDTLSESGYSFTWSNESNDGSVSLMSPIEDHAWPSEKAEGREVTFPLTAAGDGMSDGSDISSIFTSDAQFLDPPPYASEHQDALETPITPFSPSEEKDMSAGQTRHAFPAFLAPVSTAESLGAHISGIAPPPGSGSDAESSKAHIARDNVWHTNAGAHRPLPRAPIFQIPCHPDALPVYSPVDAPLRIQLPRSGVSDDQPEGANSTDRHSVNDFNVPVRPSIDGAENNTPTPSASLISPNMPVTWPDLIVESPTPVPSATLPKLATSSPKQTSGARPKLSVAIPSAANALNIMSANPPVFPVRCLTGLVERSGSQAYAQGGFSDVWRGNIVDGKGRSVEDVAIKVLRAVKMKPEDSSSSRLQTRMNREVMIWHGLRHPAIVPLRGYALEADGAPCLVSPWYDNGDVMNYLGKHPFADRRKIVRQVAEGLVYLHAQSPPVIHGDLKGANVLISRTFDAALCDFGLAKLLQDCPSSFTTSNVGMGTLRWCAPELLMEGCEKKTQASDVWAFAALALEINAWPTVLTLE
ncbi:hypothetical protein FRB98_001561 [Tulasnella sp. 332]|nr:hypothetical protein FRB98_001561 [Tulasnella sp. 332]